LGLQVISIELGVKVTVPIRTLQKLLPAPVDKLAEQLAAETQKAVQARALGYFPALNYFLDIEEFPAFLIDAANDVCTLAAEIVTAKIHEVLIPIFSQVQLNDVQCIVFSLPTIRPGKADTMSKLIKHYTPNVIKFSLVLSLLQNTVSRVGLEKYADNTVHRWLSESFEEVDISSVRLISR